MGPKFTSVARNSHHLNKKPEADVALILSPSHTSLSLSPPVLRLVLRVFQFLHGEDRCQTRIGSHKWESNSGPLDQPKCQDCVVSCGCLSEVKAFESFVTGDPPVMGLTHLKI